MNPHDTTVLVGLDDGQGILKVCMTVQTNSSVDYDSLDQDETEQGRAHYSEVRIYFSQTLVIEYIFPQGVCSKEFKNSSVKKLLILAAWPDVPEAYLNLKQMLELLEVEALQFSISADIKMCKS